MDKQDTQLPQTSFNDVDSKLVRVVFSPSPLSAQEYSTIPCGSTVGSVVQHYAPNNVESSLVELNGNRLPYDHWNTILKESDHIVIAIRLEDPVSTFVAANIGAIVVSALIGTASLLAGYFLFRPEDPDDDDDHDRLSSIRGMRNGMRKYEPFRAVLGERRIAPDYITQPYTFRRGEDEWFRCLFSVGYGPLDVDPDNFRLGETPLSDFTANVAHIDYYNTHDLEPLEDIWPRDVVEEAVGVDLKTNDTYTQASAGVADKISLEFLSPRGLTSSDKHGRGKGRALSIGHEYTCTDTNNRIKLLRFWKSGLEDSTRFRPRPLSLIRMSDGQYRVSVNHRIGSRNAWDDTRSGSLGNFVNQSPSPRNIRMRSWTFPEEAILKFVRINGATYAFVDADVLDGTPRTLLTHSSFEDTNGDTQHSWSEEPAGTWSVDSPLCAVARYGSNTRQRRFDIEYAPISATTLRPLRTQVTTYTTKVYPNESTTSGFIDDVTFTKFRTLREFSHGDFEKLLGSNKSPIRYIDGDDTITVHNFKQVVIALDIRATEQLSGTVDNFNVLAKSVVPSDWNADWRNWPTTPQEAKQKLKPTDNPADIYRWMLQGPMTDNPIGNSRVDLDGLLEWRNSNDEPAPSDGVAPIYAGPQWRISYEMIENQSLKSMLQKIAFTGRAEFAFDSNTGYGVVQKIRQDYPVQIFTPKNSRDFSAARVFPEKVDGIRFDFDNELKDYQQDEDIFYDPRQELTPRTGKNTGIALLGVPSRDMAYRMARLQYYEETLQRERYTITTDIEGLVPKRGSLVYIQSDVLDVGLGSGRVLGVDGFSMFGDEDLDLAVDQTYGVIFRTSNGEIKDAVEATYKGDGEFLFTTSIDDIYEGDFYSYGTLDSEIIPAMVVGVDYSQDLVCTLTLVNYDVRVFDIDDNPQDDPIPDFISQLNERIEFIPPNAPLLETLEDLASIDIAKQQIYLDVEHSNQIENDVANHSFQVRFADLDPALYEEGEDPLEGLNADFDGEPEWESAGSILAGESLFTYQGIERGKGYRFRARTRGRTDLFSAYSTPVNVIIPLSFPPDDVTVVDSYNNQDGTWVTWDRIIDPDLDGYEVRSSEDPSDAVGTTSDNKLNVGYLDFSKTNTFYVYARTVYGEYSDNPASIIATAPVFEELDLLNVDIENIDRDFILNWEHPFDEDAYPVRSVKLERELPDGFIPTGFRLINAGISTETITLRNQVEGIHKFRFTVNYAGGNQSIAVLVDQRVRDYIPPNITGITQNDTVKGTVITWDQIAENLPNFRLQDFDFYEIRSNTNVGSTDGLLETTRDEIHEVGFLNKDNLQDIFIYARSRQGVYSLSATMFSTSVPEFKPFVASNFELVNVDFNIRLDWVYPSSVSYNVVGARIRRKLPTSTSFTELVPRVDGNNYKLEDQPEGTHEFEIAAVYEGGGVSSFVSNSVLVRTHIPPAITGFTQDNSQVGSVLSWASVSSDLPNFTASDLDFYEVRENSDVGNTNGLLTRTSALNYNAGFLNSSDDKQVRVFAHSKQGKYSTSSVSTPVTPPLFEEVKNLSLDFDGYNISCDWVLPDSSSLYPIRKVEVRINRPDDINGIENSSLVSESITDTINISGNASHRGLNTVYVTVVYAGGGNSIAVSSDVTIPMYIPPQVQFRTQTDKSDGTLIRWQPIESTADFDVEYLGQYEVTVEDDGEVEVLTTTSGTSLNIGYVNGTSPRTFNVRAISTKGFYSPDSLFTPNGPTTSTVRDLVVVPINNSVNIDWNAPTDSVYPIKEYVVEERLPTRTSFQRVGTVSATHLSIVEREGGSYDYRVATVDEGGNRSEFVTATTRVLQPTDFVLFFDEDADMSKGTYVGGALGTNDGDVAGYFPLWYRTGINKMVDVFQEPVGTSHTGEFGLRFTVDSKTQFNKATVHPYFTGLAKFQLYDFDSGVLLQEVEMDVIGNQNNEVILNMEVDVGINYWLTTDGGNFMRTDPGVSFPIIDGPITFTIGTNVSGGTADRWYYYFGLEYSEIADDKTVENRIQQAADATGVTFDAVTIQNKIDNVGEWIPQYTKQTSDGYGMPITPSNTDSGYQQTFDIYSGEDEGSFLVNGTTISFAPRITNMSPEGENVSYKGFIETSEDGINWEPPIEGTQTFIETPFRYFRVTLIFITNDDTTGLPYIRMDGINVTVDVKQVTDQGEDDIVGIDDPNFPTEIYFRQVRASDGTFDNYFSDILSVTATVEEFDPEDLENPNRGTKILSNGNIVNDAEIVTVKTEFEYREDPNDDTSPIVFDRFRVYAQGPDGKFIPAKISWIARGISNVVD